VVTLRWLSVFGALLAGLTMTGYSVSATSAAAGALPADQMVFVVTSSGGLVPPVLRLGVAIAGHLWRWPGADGRE
jgi:hypothetical protein